jgi:hypothetical protein
LFLGIGGVPESPAELYLIPLDGVYQPYLLEQQLKEFGVKDDNILSYFLSARADPKSKQKGRFSIFSRSLPTLLFVSLGTAAKALDLNLTKLLLTSQHSFIKIHHFFSLVALQHGSAKKLGSFEQAISWEGEF